MTRILFIGDVVGRPGRTALRTHLPAILAQHPADLVVANGENAAGGFGLNRAVADELFALGIDALTLGNHAFDHEELAGFIGQELRIVRPLNFRADAPGAGVTTVRARSGAEVAIINAIGQTFMGASYDSPFVALDTLLGVQCGLPAIRLVDFHAEASSEKQALGWFLDGRVSAVLGTHTHVPTSDHRIMPKGTAYQTDVGMTGPFDSVIGMDAKIALMRFTSYRGKAFQVAKRNVWICGTYMHFDAQGRCTHIEPVQLRLPDAEN